MYTLRTWVAPALLLALSAACADTNSRGIDPSSITATDNWFPSWITVTVTPGSASVAVGATSTLQATAKSIFGQTLTGSLYTPTWSSADTTLAKVSSTGVVTGVRAGTVKVIAKVGQASGTSTITVTGSVQPAPAISSTTTQTSTTTTTTGTTTSSSSSTGQGVSGVALVSDDFAEYANTAAFLANVSSNIGGTASPSLALYNDGTSANLAEIDPTVTYNGHATLKYNQPGGTSASPSLSVGFKTGSLAKMWFRTKIRFSPGFTTTGTLTNSANAYKLLGWGWDVDDGSGRLEITNTVQYDFYWNIQSKSTGALIGGGQHNSPGYITTEWTDGGWYDYIIECDFSQVTNGVCRIWMARDGQTPVLKATTSGSMTNGGALPGINRISLGLNFNQVRAASQSQALWYGEWEVIDGTQHPDPYGLGVQ